MIFTSHTQIGCFEGLHMADTISLFWWKRPDSCENGHRKGRITKHEVKTLVVIIIVVRLTVRCLGIAVWTRARVANTGKPHNWIAVGREWFSAWGYRLLSQNRNIIQNNINIISIRLYLFNTDLESMLMLEIWTYTEWGYITLGNSDG